MAKLSEEFPIYDITSKGVIVSDNMGTYSVGYKLKLPTIFSVGPQGYKTIVESMRSFIEALGDDILLHFQYRFYKEFFSLGKKYKGNFDNFLERAYHLHFNERHFLNMEIYLFISKTPDIYSGKSIMDPIISKEYGKSNDDLFISTIESCFTILKSKGFSYSRLTYENLVSSKGPISTYYNFSNSGIEELKDISFENNSVFVGSTRVHLHTIENLEQYPTDNIDYYSSYNELPVSNLFSFSYNLKHPHIVNQYIYVPNQKKLEEKLNKKLGDLNGFNVKGGNDKTIDDLGEFLSRLSDEGIKGVYSHTNIMSFEETPDKIKKDITEAFNQSGFKKKENTLSRKDLFLGGIPGNGIQVAMRKDALNCLITDLEASSFSILEENYRDNTTALGGMKLCDPIYGIPYEVDIFGEPKKQGLIKNQNVVILSGSGGGKSYVANLIAYNEYRQGAHFFAIDASFSYRLQCEMHGGVYLTYDDHNKITFNPFYVNWIEDYGMDIINNVFLMDRDQILNDKEEEKELSDSIDDVGRVQNLLEDKIKVLSGLLVAMSKEDNEQSSKFEKSIFRNLIFNYIKDRCVNKKTHQMKFDDFYDYFKSNIQSILKDNELTKQDFNYSTFLFVLKQYCTGQSLGYLLNSEDQKIKNLDKERFVVVDVSRIRENPEIFSVVSVLAMDLYNQKIAKLPIGTRKILDIDEAWQAISSPGMATFMKSQVKIIRKYGGLTIFISQELDDFISSEILKESVINNSAIKIFADMGEFLDKFEPIKRTMAISDVNEAKIRSLNKNKRANALYKDICICWEGLGQVFGVETPLELKAIFETDPDEVKKILPEVKDKGIQMTAINYADRFRAENIL